ncbi:MAG: cupin domain-containing protein [Spirochaetaceae bacterium]|nr:MAG: cupin domain-containing protein [Spirochaetaceae bacterium]
MTREPEAVPVPDDGTIPNNRLPFLVYRAVWSGDDGKPRGPEWFESRFAANGWTASWRNGVYAYHHYHSNTHEVLGVYAGRAVVRVGGEAGFDAEIRAGDVVVIPAGGGHKRISSSRDFGVVGAYPDGASCDMRYGKPGERPSADRAIDAVALPRTDPIYGDEGPLVRIWKDPPPRRST